MIKFRNGFYGKLFTAIFCAVCVVFLCAFGIFGSLIAGQSDRIPWGIKIFGIMFCCVWLLFFLSVFVFTKKVVVTKDKIVVKRYGRELWSLDGNDIKECKCYYNNALYFTIPNERMMEFVLKSTDSCAVKKCIFGYYERRIYISVKNAKKMAEMGYNVSFPTHSD